MQSLDPVEADDIRHKGGVNPWLQSRIQLVMFCPLPLQEVNDRTHKQRERCDKQHSSSEGNHPWTPLKSLRHSVRVMYL